MAFTPTIGLEIHAELATATKMFCRSKNDPDEERPNANVCPICMAHPGTLPVVNRDAVKHVLRVGAALGGALAGQSEFDRKSYFYPDIPKGYQISQYEHPLVAGGELAGVAITRVHLEEDTARSTHTPAGTLVDFNRAGVPLMELVTEPVIQSAEEAGRFARALQLLLRTLGASGANLEKGQMRVEANISVSRDSSVYGTKVEVKNLNSFRSVERAIAYEIERQSRVIEEGGAVVQETRGWDEGRQQTFSQRLKEGSADYRYFPDPDLPPLRLSENPELTPEAITATLPELPAARRARYAERYALKAGDIEHIVNSVERSAFFDALAGELAGDAALVQIAANYLVSDLTGIYAKRGGESYAALDPKAFAALVRMIAAKELSSRGGKDVLALLVEEGGDPRELATKRGLLLLRDAAALQGFADAVIAAEPGAVAEYRGGKQAALEYLVGKAMQASRGAGDPGELRELIASRLTESR
ncbi:MAG: Asp-tRNA(Asn)/Glu-tRNA(Gln) amidotransferase subunit GatB [Patescibacteria group bacterium]|nr:Asp-tRNA(Asn)/Glu-tRNA(Gln) amidotransferase subunit GatB [Patescibacteria group bacterium]MDE2057918.1 Asp-tRNA(Asn)/Glu-tRNA(Gln) amidotransferase subunit GatB [Patescibacteria group bacterium]